MRNALVHQYFEIDRELVWQVVQEDLHKLKAAIEGILREEKPTEEQ